MLKTILKSQRKTPAGIAMVLIAASTLTACGEGFRDSFRSQRYKETFDGVYYKAKSQKVAKEERDHFTVTVSRVGQGLSGARQAGAHEATKYCIKEYGTSKIDWVVAPDSESVIPVDDKIQLEGYCRP
ncbi:MULTISPECIES: hypothetical protein [unclassified Shimia]|uniref:hypothetical protein n=1 Tax=unclassified Shimia TaxID=2630038 RepID=UPI00310BCA4B